VERLTARFDAGRAASGRRDAAAAYIGAQEQTMNDGINRIFPGKVQQTCLFFIYAIK
jgi:hypothetical protein